MIFGKRQVVIAGLVVALGVAVYLNWSFNNLGNDLETAGLVSSSKNYGDTAYVNNSLSDSSSGQADVSGNASGAASVAAGSPFFEEARANRQKAREESLNVLKDVLNNVQADDAAKSEALAASTQYAQDIESEGKIENLIRAKGFADCMVYLNGQKADVIVQPMNGEAQLIASEVAQLKEIITSNTKVSAENIKIIPSN